jgi:transposase
MKKWSAAFAQSEPIGTIIGVKEECAGIWIERSGGQEKLWDNNSNEMIREVAMIDKSTIFEIHRLKNAGLSQRRIAQKLNLSRAVVKKYLDDPEQVFDVHGKKRTSKLDPYMELIDEFMEREPDVKAPVVLQRLQAKGFDGEITIVRDYLRQKRGRVKNRQAFIRFESSPGEQIQVDWGHFDALCYGETKRKLYALAMTECYSRMLYVQFAHSQKQELVHQGLMNGFKFFGGSPKELVVDNMLTAVKERVGRVIGFNGAFLDFLRPLKVFPRACNLKAPHEKGKIESVIGYIKKNFWPLRSFDDLHDVQNQADDWRDTVANVRIHETTGQRPVDRFREVDLTPLPVFSPDLRETCHPKVYKDFQVKFDANTYTVPPSMIGKRVTLKADLETVTIYYQDKKLAVHERSWERKKRIENPAHVERVKKLRRQLWHDEQIWVFTSMGQEAVDYLDALAGAGLPIRNNVSKLLRLKDEYGTGSLMYAIGKALSYKAYGADYIENILYQEMTPETSHPPVRLKDEALNRIRLSEPSLADYDAHILQKRRKDD